MIIVLLLIFIIIIKLAYDFFQKKYSEQPNITVVNSKKEYEKIQKIIDKSINKKEMNDNLKQYIETIA